MKGVVSRVTSEKVLKAFSLKGRVLSTRDAVGATLQTKLSTFVKAACRYDVPFPRTQKLQTHTHAHTHKRNTYIIIIDIYIYIYTCTCNKKSQGDGHSLCWWYSLPRYSVLVADSGSYSGQKLFKCRSIHPHNIPIAWHIAQLQLFHQLVEGSFDSPALKSIPLSRPFNSSFSSSYKIFVRRQLWWSLMLLQSPYSARFPWRISWIMWSPFVTKAATSQQCCWKKFKPPLLPATVARSNVASCMLALTSVLFPLKLTSSFIHRK